MMDSRRNPRILVATDAVGGVWVYSVELARALGELGVEAVLAVMGPSPDECRREAAAGLRLIDTGLPLDWLETSPAELRHSGDVLAGIATREGVDVVQTSSAALLANTRFDQPCVAVQHSCVATWWSAVKATAMPDEFLWRRELVEAGLNRAAAVVAPSVAFAADTARTYQLSMPVVAVPNGRRTVLPQDLPRGDFVFTASRLWDEGKNVATLDRAAANLDFPFQAAGALQGPNGAATSLSHIHALGELGHSRLAGLLAARPVFASAALYEPFGLSALEAAQAGCALVLSDIPTHREIWGDAAVFVPARDDAAFTAAIERLFANVGQRHDLGERASARAALYTPERMARGMAEIYAGVLESEPQLVAGAA
ncbi:MAG TPA: glycosyltransferase family 4 protein [Sphingomicrobium sp.]|nr:glycosyltransferase family 4 protein [Sphingomicrobium sp.]